MDKNGEIANYVAAKRDITRESELEDQLRQSQKMEAVGQLAGGIAHDFNNLLQVISGHTELLLLSTELGGCEKSSLEDIGAAAQRGALVVGRLLAFSRRQVIHPVDLNLNEVVKGFLEMSRGLFGEDIDVVFLEKHDLETVHADQGLLEQALMNLCMNSRDAMPAGGTLTIDLQNITLNEQFVRMHSGVEGGHYVLMRVTDTGCGMDDKTCERVFDPFFTTKEVGKGTGLGLSMAFGLIKQHGGYINVSSKVDEGATFEIYLPAVERPVFKDREEKLSLGRGGDETILIVEDDVAILMLTEKFLSGAGYSVLIAKDGVEALQVFKKNIGKVDLVMMDVVMPNMGGGGSDNPDS